MGQALEMESPFALDPQAAHLSSQRNLLPLRVESLDHALCLHAAVAGVGAVDAKTALPLIDLLRLQLGQRLDGCESRVLRQRGWDALECFGECAIGILLDSFDLNESTDLPHAGSGGALNHLPTWSASSAIWIAQASSADPPP